MTHRVNEDKGGQMSVRDAVSLEADRHHVAVAGLEAEWPRHLDVPA